MGTNCKKLKSWNVNGRLRTLRRSSWSQRPSATSEVWSHLNDWEASIRAEFQQLVNTKQAVRQASKGGIHRLANKAGLPIELLPGKMVHTRKAGSGAYRSRAVVCGNYQESGAMNAMLVVPMAIKFELKYVSTSCWTERMVDLRN